MLFRKPKPYDTLMAARGPDFRSHSTTWSRACATHWKAELSRRRRSGVSYAYEFSGRGLTQFQRLDPWLAEEVLDEMEALVGNLPASR